MLCLPVAVDSWLACLAEAVAGVEVIRMVGGSEEEPPRPHADNELVLLRRQRRSDASSSRTGNQPALGRLLIETRRWPNAIKVIVAGRSGTASKPITASVNGWTTSALGCSSWATRRAVPPLAELKESTGAGSMKTTITRSPKNNSSIRRSDLSTAGVDGVFRTVDRSFPDRSPTAGCITAELGPGADPKSAGAVSAILYGKAPCRTARDRPRQRVGACRANRPQRTGSGCEPHASPTNFADLHERVPLASELTRSDWDTVGRCPNRRIQAWRALAV